jgi:hypothetical protein
MSRNLNLYVAGCFTIVACVSSVLKAATESKSLIATSSKRISPDNPAALDLDKVYGNPQNGRNVLLNIFRDFQTYRKAHNGEYPFPAQDFTSIVLASPKVYGYDNWDAVWKARISPDNIYDGRLPFRKYATKIATDFTLGKRANGSQLGGTKQTGTEDVLAYVSTYNRENPPVAGGKRSLANPVGYYLVLWDNGNIEEVPYDKAFFTISSSSENFLIVFPQQAGVPATTLTYEEWTTSVPFFQPVPIGYPVNSQTQQPNIDNGAYESLVTLSRLLNAPDEREPIWNALGRATPQFTLKQVREGAAKLKLPLQNKKLTLVQLAALRSPAILQMRNILAQNPLNPRPSASTSTPTSIVPTTTSNNRIVTLAQSGIEYSIVQDAGMTRVVRNVELAKLYSGEALLPQAANTPSALKIDNPVRVVPFQTKSDEVVQTVTLTNEGTTPLTLEIERPLPGVTRAELSSKTLAAGASATLTLNLKWREVLPGDVQQVFVTLKTSDPIQPRAMLGFRLQVPPAPPLNASPDSGAKPPVLP